MIASPKGGLGLLALGGDNGTVSLWDLTRGVLAAKLGKVRFPSCLNFVRSFTEYRLHTQGQNLKAITGIAFSKDGPNVYTASSDSEILEWDLKVIRCSCLSAL